MVNNLKELLSNAVSLSIIDIDQYFVVGNVMSDEYYIGLCVSPI